MGKCRDRIAGVETLAATRRPDRIGPEQADELVGKLVVLGVFGSDERTCADFSSLSSPGWPS